MYKVKLVVNNNERWVRKVHYEYFCPVEINEAFYLKYLYKNFPYEFSDATNLYPYNKYNIPDVKPTKLDKKLQRESLDYARYPFHNRIKSHCITNAHMTGEELLKEDYYNELAIARHKKGLDYGLVPNYTNNYDKYIRPVQNMRARTKNIVIGGIFSLELESSASDDYLYEWMLTGSMKEGKLVFYDGDLDPVFKIEFWDCYCVGIGEQMTSDWNVPMKLHLRLSPAITRNRSAEHEKIWKITDIHKPYKVIPKTEVSYYDLYMVDEKNNRIDEVYAGQKVELVIKTTDSIGETITINLANEKYSYKYNGQVLENNTLRDYYISLGVERIPLEVIKQQNLNN